MLEQLRYVAKKELGVSVQAAVIAILNYFSKIEIAGTLKAASLAKL